MHIDTAAIHAGQEPDALTGAVSVPVYLTSTYVQDGVGGLRGGHDYSRTINPTRTALERCIAELEHGREGIAFASGMAATTTVIHAFPVGTRILAVNDVYGGTYRVLTKVLRDQGYVISFADLADERELAVALGNGVDLVWVETPTNPLLKVLDIERICALAHDAGAKVVVDNTFASPYLQTPLTLGADVVVHSTTKYLGGHSDVIGGAVVTSDPELSERIRFLQNAIGAVPGPLDCFLVLRGIKTLAVRMRQHCENAHAVTAFLEGSAVVSEVFYPGLEGHPQHAIADRQMREYGGMVSFRVHGGQAAALALLEQTGLWSMAESLGGVESLVEHPAAMTHASLAGSGFEIPDDLIRLSVGIEHVDDLLADLEQMLARAAKIAGVPA